MQEIFEKHDSLTKAERILKRRHLIIKNKIKKRSKIIIEGTEYNINFISEKSYYLFTKNGMLDPLDILK